LIIAESGYLDRAVTVEAIDTMAEPVKLNIKSGETYQRIDLLRALLVKSPNDVARCLARDNAGSIAAFADRMNQRARELGPSGSRPGRDVIVVVLGDSKAGVWRDASALLSWGLWM